MLSNRWARPGPPRRASTRGDLATQKRGLPGRVVREELVPYQRWDSETGRKKARCVPSTSPDACWDFHRRRGGVENLLCFEFGARSESEPQPQQWTVLGDVLLEVVWPTSVLKILVERFGSHYGDLSEYPITAVIAVPPDQKSAAILLGRFQSRNGGVQMVRSVNVIDQLLDTIFTVESYVVAGDVVVGLATLALAALAFMLSLRLRRREIETLFKIGGSRLNIASVMASEIVIVLLTVAMLATGLTVLTSHFGPAAIREFLTS